ncbi:hypothetical protein BaRGS_00033774 [Batillaria attramentaria]|uniref:Uncharacterized protein n=1 Tax=Batillaria attramentaria TaxID=370345 RepID=A0ABD0JJL6_9CAEN
MSSSGQNGGMSLDAALEECIQTNKASFSGSGSGRRDSTQSRRPTRTSIGGRCVTPKGLAEREAAVASSGLYDNVPEVTDRRILRGITAIKEAVAAAKQRLQRGAEASEYFEYSNVLKTLKTLYEETDETPSAFFLGQLGEVGCTGNLMG